MKIAIATALSLATSFSALAQRNEIFADLAVSDISADHAPSISATYNYKLSRIFGVGGGAQTVYYPYYSSHVAPNYQLRTALFVDVRRYIPIRKKSLIFGMLDLGVDLYHSPGGQFEGPHNNGFGLGLGAGYCYKATKRGSGPYATLKMVSDTYTAPEYTSSAGTLHKASYIDALLLFAVGFKF